MSALPKDANIAIIAGRGCLPQELNAAMKAKGKSILFVGIEDEFEPWLLEEHHIILNWGQLGKLFKIFRQNKITHATMVGSMTRPKVNISKMDFGTISSLPHILAFMLGGDNTLLKGVINVFERNNVTVLGAHELMPELLAEEGMIAGSKPSGKAELNISKAFEACKMLGQLDIGQAAVSIEGRVVAVEGIEGTDGMLKRVAELRKIGKLRDDRNNGVLVKTMKPGQEIRVDLPAIGPHTIEAVIEAGLKGIAVESGQSLVLLRKETIARAREGGVFIMGIAQKPEID